MSRNRGTINERVMDAADDVDRKARNDPNYNSTQDRDHIFSKATDPNSDWPEPALKGAHLEGEMRRWLPQESPRKQAAARAAMPMKLDPSIVGGDMVSGVNESIGEYNTSQAERGRHTGAQGR